MVKDSQVTPPIDPAGIEGDRVFIAWMRSLIQRASATECALPPSSLGANDVLPKNTDEQDRSCSSTTTPASQ